MRLRWRVRVYTLDNRGPAKFLKERRFFTERRARRYLKHLRQGERKYLIGFIPKRGKLVPLHKRREKR